MQGLQNRYTYMTVIPVSNPSAAELFVSIFRQGKLELQTPISRLIDEKSLYLPKNRNLSDSFFYEMISFHKLFFRFESHLILF